MLARRLWLLLVGLLTAGSQGHLEDLTRRNDPAPAANRQTVGGPSTQEGLPRPTAAGTAPADPSLHVMDIRMPGVRPHMEDQYICSSVQMPAGTEYIINFEALASADRAHHLLVYGCRRPGSISPWDCRMICQEGKQQIIYAWARNAPPTHMPPNVGFQVGGEGVQTLVLQIHYKKPIDKTEEADNSGVRLTLSKQRQKYIAGIFLLLRYDITIPPHRAVTHGDASCKYTGPASLYPFGFRVHAHTLSPVISAYFNNGNWSLLGKGNPQWPQAFYPIEEHKEIKPGDLMFARCTYDSTNRDTTTLIGGRHTDEMCNFYLMYYTDSQRGQTFFQCDRNNYKEMFRMLPPGNDVPPPANHALEEQAEGHHHHPPHQTDQAVVEAAGWPTPAADDGVALGQVAGVGVDSHGNVHVFHRGSRVWDQRSFDGMNKFKNPAEGPIKENTIITYNPQGKVIKKWGANMFFMPHGLHIDDQDNIWVTDVALHQVFKFPRDSKTASITLGTKLVPGKDDHHFCKPTDVATLSTGEFFVTDGYCNQRVIKYSKDGKILKEWGTMTKMTKSDGSLPPNSFDIPHSVTVAEKRGWVCVADRENGRIQCFTVDGDFVKQFHPKEFYGRLFAVTYSAITDTLYAVNGPDLYNNKVPVKGFSIHPDTGHLMETWAPKDGFRNPHDLAVSPQGDFIYVAELDPHKVWRMYVRKETLNAQKDKKAGPLSHPSSVDGGAGSDSVDKGKENDLGASLVIGSLLVVPVIFIVGVTVFVRLRKNAKHGYKKTKLLIQEVEDDDSEEDSEEEDLRSSRP